jgi:hypothetical protein
MTTRDDDLTELAWNKIAAGHDRTNTPSQMWLGNEGLHRAGLRPRMRFLEVAPGNGALGIPAAHPGAQVLATDTGCSGASRASALYRRPPERRP